MTRFLVCLALFWWNKKKKNGNENRAGLPNVAVWGGHRPGGRRCGRPVRSAPHLAAKEQCATEWKIASRKNTVNPKQVSFVFPMNISVLAVSRTVICGWLSSYWLPKPQDAYAWCLQSSAPRLKNVENSVNSGTHQRPTEALWES